MPAPSLNQASPTGNRLLDALPNGERERLLQAMKRLPIRPKEMLQEPGRAMRQVYFPLSGVVSLMIPLVEGMAIETATIGNEGMVGVHAFLGGGPLGNGQAMSQVSGQMLAMNVDTFRAEANGDGKLRSVMLAYTQALFAQISQAVACNGVHEIQQRTAKWLLETHDRAGGSDTFDLTQEFLADMLGVTRPSVSVAAHTLQMAGLIRYRRGQITVLDREALEESACECYASVRKEYERLLGRT
jgi:CRP-like cAMP-binding protein